ncbi:MAG TPA: DUF2723 domain-containing protein [Candidatus Paceibacterota bacterium]|nr:DUF2723 domain-containing protein [Candidatus Paceibacterota bacterium]
MIPEAPLTTEGGFLRKGLPWLIAATALLLYLATLNHWVTLSSVQLAAMVNGWNWRPMLSQPLLFLLTLPCHLLPAQAVPLALNLLTAIGASLTVALLARSVALLPHDRLEEQRVLVEDKHALLSVSAAWVPIVLAATALGLQLSFWENATAASGEILDLLLFAYIVRCLLEYRLDQRRTWLDRASLVCGAAMANSWSMVGLLPLFVVAVLWTRGLSFFKLRFFRRIERSGWQSARPAVAADLRFILRMALLGLAGLSLLFVLPLVCAVAPDSTVGFWQALRAIASSYKNILLFLSNAFVRRHRDVALLLVAVSLLPVLLLSIKWRAFASNKSWGQLDLVSLIIYLSHVFLLLVCVWVAFDPPISPRHIGSRLGFALPFLPLYYLSALSIGYYSGFFLLVFSRYSRSRRILRRALGWAAPALVYVLLGLTLTGLLLKNFPAIRAANGPHLAQYAGWLVQSLPPEGGVMLAEDSLRLALIEAALARGTNAASYLLAETPALSLPEYRAYLERRHSGRWPELAPGPKLTLAADLPSPADGPLNVLEHLQLLIRLTENNRVFYLQPGLGLLPERFNLEPRGMIYELKSYPTNSFTGPPLTSTQMAENEAFWQRAIEAGVNPLLRLLDPPGRLQSGFAGRLMKLGHLELSPPVSAQALAPWYSAALNSWGVTLQRNGRPQPATPCFELALKLNADNVPARVNLQCNSNLLAGAKMTVLRSNTQQDQLGKYRNWNQLLTRNGPFDDPTYCFQLGVAYATEGFGRQAGQQFERAMALAPGEIPVQLAFGGLLNSTRMPDRALQIVARIRADPKLQPLSEPIQAELALLEAGSWFVKTNAANAERIIYSLLASRPGDVALLNRAATTFATYHSYSNVLHVTDRQLKLTPDDPFVLLAKGAFSNLVGDYTNAIPALTRSLSLTNTYAARIGRALAYFRTDQLDAAEADYQALLQGFPGDYQGWQGLAEIARQKGDTNAAVRYYQRFLSSARPGSQEAMVVAERLRTLQSDVP